MKKIDYLEPEIKVVKLDVIQMICASGGESQTGGLSDDEEDGDPD